MITVNGEQVHETRTEWVVHRQKGLAPIVLDHQDYDEAEARQVADLEDSVLHKRTIYVMEDTPCLWDR